MEVHLGGAVALDLATKDDIDGVGSSFLSGIRGDRFNRLPIPIKRVGHGTGVGDDSPITMPFGTVPTGSVWHIFGLSCFTDDNFTVVSGITAALFVGESSNPSLSQCELPGLNFPKYVNLNAPIWASGGESVFLVTNGTVEAGQILGANIRALEYLAPAVSRLNGGV